MSEDLERRVELLESDVETLTAALRSVLEWRIGERNTSRLKNGPAAELRLVGPQATEEILDRLP